MNGLRLRPALRRSLPLLLLLPALAVLRRSGGDAAALSTHRDLVCAHCGHAFAAAFEAGDAMPRPCPGCGKRSAFPCEWCYWTGDGEVAERPTPVLLNRYRGQAEPTFCTECGRLVRPHNPAPISGRPPPTRAQFAAWRAQALEE